MAGFDAAGVLAHGEIPVDLEDWEFVLPSVLTPNRRGLDWIVVVEIDALQREAA